MLAFSPPYNREIVAEFLNNLRETKLKIYKSVFVLSVIPSELFKHKGKRLTGTPATWAHIYSAHWHTYTQTHLYTDTGTPTHRHTYTQTPTHRHTTHRHTYTQAHLNTDTPAHRHTYTYSAHRHLCTGTPTHRHTYTHHLPYVRVHKSA